MPTKIDQIAFGCDTATWHGSIANGADAVDTVTYNASIRQPDDNWLDGIGQAHLAFYYHRGIEIEYLYFDNGHLGFHRFITKLSSFWQFGKDIPPPTGEAFFQSHLGSHVANIEEELGLMIQPKIVMRAETINHTNPKIAGRRYKYVIIDRRDTEGYFLKLIERIVAG